MGTWELGVFMKWICDKHIIDDEIVNKIEMQIGFRFPKDFIEMVMLYDGGYPLLNRIIIDGNEEVFNNLISFDEDDESYILDIISDIEDFKAKGDLNPELSAFNKFMEVR